ncbi:MAG: DUF72 domain-containing protein [Mucilaginibacter sp.]
MQAPGGDFYGGTSGLLIPIPKRDFPPEYLAHSRLAYYATLFNSIEINSSFYRLPMPSTVAKWAADVPGNFRFTFKLWRQITHNKELVFDITDVTRFMDVINNADSRKGSVLVQFPPSLTVAARGGLAHLLNIITEANTAQWDINVEFRHRSWYNDEIYELLTSFNVGLVLQDMPKSATPQVITADNFVYLRFHGPGGSYKGSYSDEVLSEYSYYIREWQEEGKRIYVYFNNTAGDALNNLFTLKRYVAGLE